MNDTQALSHYLKTLTAEMCLKLGSALPGLMLNLPKDSLARSLSVPEKELWTVLKEYPGLYKPGDTDFSEFEGAVCIRLNPEAVASAYAEMGGNPFLRELVRLTTSGAGLEDFRRFFLSQGEVRLCPMEDEEFDLLAYYPTGEPDAFYYCLKDEGIGVDVHRFTKEDYEAFGYECK